MVHNIRTAASTEAAPPGEGIISPYTGLTSDVLPEAVSILNANYLQSGVSTHNTLFRNKNRCPDVDEVAVRWYALRATYGKEREASEYISNNGGISYCPCIKNMKLVKGKRRKVLESYLPNILFAYGSIDGLKEFVYDNANLPYLRFYEGMREVCGIMQKRPLFIPDKQMEYLKIICKAQAGGAFIPSGRENIFRVGDKVKVKEGSIFAGIEGRVARYKGQQCVGVMVQGLLTVATAYIPTYFLEKIE